MTDISSDMKDTELKSILGEAPNWIFDYLELSDDITREWKVGSKASDLGGHNQFVQTFTKRIKLLIKRETDKARTFEIKQALIVATTHEMSIEYMQEALERRLAQLKQQQTKEDLTT